MEKESILLEEKDTSFSVHNKNEKLITHDTFTDNLHAPRFTTIKEIESTKQYPVDNHYL